MHRRFANRARSFLAKSCNPGQGHCEIGPLSAIGRIPQFTTMRFVANLLAMILFGVIISFFARSAPAAGVRGRLAS